MDPLTPTGKHIFILNGDDNMAMETFVKSQYAALGDPGTADMNTARLDGRTVRQEDLRNAANAIPFLAPRRLVILTYPLARIKSDADRKGLRAFLGGLSPSTVMVLCIDDLMERGDWVTLRKDHWLRRWAKDNDQVVEMRTCALPRTAEMPGWIMAQVKALGGKIEPAAASALASHTGSATLQARQELLKLLDYVNYQRTITTADVEKVAVPGGQSDVFDMVDALANGNAQTALRQVRRLLETEEPFILFGMIVRQFRLLIQAREIVDEHGNVEDIRQEMAIHPYVAGKLEAQARGLNMPRLEAIYRRLLVVDEMVKTGQMPIELALETFIAETAR
jgi:DNA polymerase-3 subunit delta